MMSRSRPAAVTLFAPGVRAGPLHVRRPKGNGFTDVAQTRQT
jgi:hypothetical protein